MYIKKYKYEVIVNPLLPTAYGYGYGCQGMKIRMVEVEGELHSGHLHVELISTPAQPLHTHLCPQGMKACVFSSAIHTQQSCVTANGLGLGFA